MGKEWEWEVGKGKGMGVGSENAIEMGVGSENGKRMGVGGKDGKGMGVGGGKRERNQCKCARPCTVSIGSVPVSHSRPLSLLHYYVIN